MDIDGVYASLCFPSFLPGFVGQRLTLWPDSDELALAAMRAYNDWHLDAWCGAQPGRFIPNQIAYLRDPEIAAAGDPAQRRARLQGGHVLGGARQARPARRSTPATGTRSSRRAPRPARCCACTSARRAPRPPRRPTRRPRSPRCCSARTACTARSTGSTRRCRCASPTSASASPKAASAGSPGSSTASTTATSYQLGYLPTWRDVDESPSEVLRRNFWFCALDDDAGHARAGSHRRRAHPRGVRLPARRLVVARHAGDARAPAARPGRARARRAPHHVAERVGALPASGARPNSSGDRRRPSRTIAARRPERRASDPRHLRSSRSRPGDTMTWREYRRRARRDRHASLAEAYARGDRVALQIPDGPGVHARCSRVRRRGIVAVGIGSRAGTREVDHLVDRTGARTLLTSRTP